MGPGPRNFGPRTLGVIAFRVALSHVPDRRRGKWRLRRHPPRQRFRQADSGDPVALLPATSSVDAHHTISRRHQLRPRDQAGVYPLIVTCWDHLKVGREVSATYVPTYL